MLRVEGLTKRFGGLVAVKDVDLHVEEGQIFSIIGPNGAGKSTTFAMLTGMLRQTSGKITFTGVDISQMPSHQVSQLGIVTTFQKTSVFDALSVADSIAIGCHRWLRTTPIDALRNSRAFRNDERAVRETCEPLIEEFGFADKRDVLCRNLSYGEQRLLQIAVALAAKPKMLLLDEPAAGLNPGESRALTERIELIRQRGVTVLLVEHDMSVVMSLSDRIAILNFGEKIAEGTPEEVRQDPDVIAAYLGDADDA